MILQLFLLLGLAEASNVIITAHTPIGQGFNLRSLIRLNENDQIQLRLSTCRHGNDSSKIAQQKLMLEVCRKDQRCARLTTLGHAVKAQIIVEVSAMDRRLNLYADCDFVGTIAIPLDFSESFGQPKLIVEFANANVRLERGSYSRSLCCFHLQLEIYSLIRTMNRRILALSPPKQLTESPPPPPSTTSDPPPPPKCLYTVQRNNETWTIVHRRGPEFEPPRSAMNSWFLYRDGFGSNETNEYWLGLEAIHDLTKDEPKTLRIEAWSNEDKNQKWIEQVDEFAISDETDNYRLLIGDQSMTKQQGPIVRALVFHNNSQFSTADRDNDEWNGGNCAAVAGGGWWYKHCANILPTGHYYSLWVNDKPLDKVHYFDGVLMMIR